MKIFSVNQTLCFFVILFWVNCIFGHASMNNSMKSKPTHLLRKRSVIALIFTSNVSFFNTELGTAKELCRWLRGLKQQSKLCQNRIGLPQLLQETRKLAIDSCRLQFQYEQWNCSMVNIRKFFKRIYRETALLYSLATSAFMFSVSRACAKGTLANCLCASYEKSDNASWQWRGCGDNTKYATKFTKKFLQLKKKGDHPNTILRYNSEVGIKVVLEHEEKHCQCHGISGSCTLRICWKRLKSFDLIARELQNRYHRAIKVEQDNNIHKLQKRRKKKDLLFLEPSPNFCPMTVGRRCENANDCATLCCGRGTFNTTKPGNKTCKPCVWLKDPVLRLDCQQCEDELFLFCR